MLNFWGFGVLGESVCLVTVDKDRYLESYHKRTTTASPRTRPKVIDTLSLEALTSPEAGTPGSTMKFAHTASNFFRPKTTSAMMSTVMTTATM